MSREPHNQSPAPGGRAVDDEDPDASPMTGKTMPSGPAQPFDVEKVEKDRAKSQGPRLHEAGN